MLRFRWAFLVLCGLLCVVLVVPVRSADNLVTNGGFLSGIADWIRDISKGQAILAAGEFHTESPSLTPAGSLGMSYSQCVDTSGLAAVDVGGWVRFAALDSGNIGVALYSASGCSGDAFGSTDLILTDEDTQVGLWIELRQLYALPPDQEHTSVGITLNASIINSGEAYFDDIFLYEYDPTSVVLVEPAAQVGVPMALVPALAIALVVLGLARVLGRRRKG